MKPYKNIVRIFSVITACVLISVLSACDENGGITIPSGATDLSLAFKSNDNLTDNPTDVIVITEAKALITEIQYERERDGRNQLQHPGPFVISFALDGSLRDLLSGLIIQDMYTKVKFQAHKPEETETPPDPEFKTGNSSYHRFSFIIKGIYNGNSFVYRSKNTMNLVINLNKTSSINLKKQNITVLFNKTSWFKNGSVIIDPRDPQNENLIDDNI